MWDEVLDSIYFCSDSVSMSKNSVTVLNLANVPDWMLTLHMRIFARNALSLGTKSHTVASFPWRFRYKKVGASNISTKSFQEAIYEGPDKIIPVRTLEKFHQLCAELKDTLFDTSARKSVHIYVKQNYTMCSTELLQGHTVKLLFSNIIRQALMYPLTDDNVPQFEKPWARY